MKKILFLIGIILYSIPAFADLPQNEAEFLYCNSSKNNSSVRYDYINQRSYVKTSNDMYIRDDGETIYKNQSGIIETSAGKSYMPVGSGNNKLYVPMDL